MYAVHPIYLFRLYLFSTTDVGEVYVASNDGLGVFKIDMASVNVAAKTITANYVVASVTTNMNDAMNCLLIDDPFPDPCAAGKYYSPVSPYCVDCVAGKWAATGVSAESSCTECIAEGTSGRQLRYQMCARSAVLGLRRTLALLLVQRRAAMVTSHHLVVQV